MATTRTSTEQHDVNYLRYKSNRAKHKNNCLESLLRLLIGLNLLAQAVVVYFLGKEYMCLLSASS